jgi:lambda family phage minor tail protein L
MSTRAYDYKLALTSVNNFTKGNTIIGLSSNTVAEIIDISATELKVKLANSYQQFLIGESIVSNVAILRSYNAFINHSSNISGSTNVFALPATYSLVDLSDSINVYVDDVVAPRDSYVINANNTIQFLPVDTLLTLTQNNLTIFSDIRQTAIYPTNNVSSLFVQVVTGNTESASFVSANLESTALSASATLLDVSDSPYIAEKNAVEQTAIVKLYSIYYPGEWYPPNKFGNPGGSGSSFPWPYGFPIRYAEVLSDDYYSSSYDVSYGNVLYRAKAIQSDSIQIDSSGRVDEISLTISNFDGNIAALAENKNILGYNSSNSAIELVNGELVQNIDPRTVSSNEFFNFSVQQSRGANAPWDYESTIEIGDNWVPFRRDSRDLSGAVVEIKLTYAKFLDYWPEYSLVKDSASNVANVYSTSVYRVGDIVTSSGNFANTTSIVDIYDNTLVFSNNSLAFLAANTNLYIVNPDADSSAYIEHVFTINNLEELDELIARFNLTSWLQYFKQSVPKRKFYGTTCPFVYKGPDCKYPANGTGEIVGSVPTIQANGFFTLGNASTVNIAEDICPKTLTACRLRKNLVNFGGFPGAE